jgi:uncharacterized RDD family membrane protein YckC
MYNPYTPPSTSGIEQTAVVRIVDRRLATRGKRFGATFVDGIFLVISGTVLSRAYCAIADVPRTVGVIQLGMIVAAAVNWILIARRGQTIGKILFKTEIVRVDGAPARFLHGVALRTWPLLIVNYGTELLFPTLRTAVGLLGTIDALFVFSAFNRCIHDRIAGTYVVDVAIAPSSSPTWRSTPSS